MLLRGGASPTVGTVEPSSTAWLCPGSTPLHIAAALNHRDVCQVLLRWQRRRGEDLGNVRNEMGLKPSQCAMLAGHYTLASELLEMQAAAVQHTSEQRRRRRRGSSRRRADGPPAHAGAASNRGELTRETMLAMMHRAKLLVQLQTLADDERRGMAALRHQLRDEEGGAASPAPRAGSNPELVLLRNTINALQEALQVGALPGGGGAGGAAAASEEAGAGGGGTAPLTRT